MWGRSLRSWVHCLVGLLLYLFAIHTDLDGDDLTEIATALLQDKSASGFINSQNRHVKVSPLKLPLFPLGVQAISMPLPPSDGPAISPATQNPTSSASPFLFAPNANAWHSSSPTESLAPLPLPAMSSINSPSLSPPSSHAPSLLHDDPAQPPLPLNIGPPSPSSPSVNSTVLAAPTASATSTPLASSPSQDSPANGSTTSSDPPLTSPSSGCCAANTVRRPGLRSDSCTCVYPIRLELLVENVSTKSADWSSEFQEELATELDVKLIQIEITSFEFSGPNLSLVIIIGPLISSSFSAEKAGTIKTDLVNYKVHFNSSLFGNYTLLQFRYFQSPTLAPVEGPVAGMASLPVLQTVPDNAEVDRTKRLGPWHYIAIAAAAAVVASGVLIVAWKCLISHRGQKTRYKNNIEEAFKALSRPFGAPLYNTVSIPQSITTRLFTYDELKQATNNFEPASVLGEGGFGRVYKGVLKDGTAVAIKRLTGGSQGDREFLVEIEMLSRLHHRNLVKLVGYYTSKDSPEHLLCYELIPNGSLEAWLHGPLGTHQPLEWDTRMKIALDAARGLAYLHEDSQPCVIHRDFKASNILIENNFHAKVADFGLAKQAPEGQINYVATRVMGTFGYVAPEYAMTGHLLVKSDVYSYGVVLLELLSGRKPVDMSQPSGQENLVTWARPILRDKERLWELGDPRLNDKYPREDFAQVAAIAAACVAPEASQRPTMGEVVQSLKMVQRSSEYATSGERNTSMDVTLPISSSNKSCVSSIQHAQQTSAIFESDASSSVFSSGPFSGLVLEQDTFSRTGVFSEDLHEGR